MTPVPRSNRRLGARLTAISPECTDVAMLRRVASPEGAAAVGREDKPGAYASNHYFSPITGYYTDARQPRDYPQITIDVNGQRKVRLRYAALPGRDNMLQFPVDVEPALVEDVALPVVEADFASDSSYNCFRKTAVSADGRGAGVRATAV
jgi:hypothetical protein